MPIASLWKADKKRKEKSVSVHVCYSIRLERYEFDFKEEFSNKLKYSRFRGIWKASVDSENGNKKKRDKDLKP